MERNRYTEEIDKYTVSKEVLDSVFLDAGKAVKKRKRRKASFLAALMVAATVSASATGVYLLTRQEDNSYELTFAMNVNASDEEGAIRFKENDYLLSAGFMRGGLYGDSNEDPDSFQFHFAFKCSGKNVESVTVAPQGNTAIAVYYYDKTSDYRVNGTRTDKYPDGTAISDISGIGKKIDMEIYSSVTLTPKDMSEIMKPYQKKEEDDNSYPAFGLSFIGREPGGFIEAFSDEEIKEMKNEAQNLMYARRNIENRKEKDPDAKKSREEIRLEKREKQFSEKYGRAGRYYSLLARFEDATDAACNIAAKEKAIESGEVSGEEVQRTLDSINRWNKVLEQDLEVKEEYNSLLEEYADELNEKYKDVSMICTVNFKNGTSEEQVVRLHAETSTELLDRLAERLKNDGISYLSEVYKGVVTLDLCYTAAAVSFDQSQEPADTSDVQLNAGTPG